MSIPQDMSAFNEKVITEFRANGGKLSGQMSSSKVLLLTTTGARSGLERTVVIGYRPYGDAYAVIASNNGAPASPHWFHNLLADPTAIAEVGPEKFRVKARVTTGEERREAAERIEYLERQQATTKREIPVLLLEKV